MQSTNIKDPYLKQASMSYLINKDFEFKKSFGQNFLIDNQVKSKFINSCNIENQICVEIGSGDGSITTAILEKNPKMLYCIEKDHSLYNLLLEKFKHQTNIKLFHADALDFNYNTIFSQHSEKVNFIGGLPYNVGTDIVVSLFRYKNNINTCYFILQKEVAKKFCAKNDSDHINLYSAIASCFSNSKYLFDISQHCFFPKPNVTSGAFLLNMQDKPIMQIFKNYDEAIRFFKTAFQFRKKNLLHLKKTTSIDAVFKGFEEKDTIKVNFFIKEILKNLT